MVRTDDGSESLTQDKTSTDVAVSKKSSKPNFTLNSAVGLMTGVTVAATTTAFATFIILSTFGSETVPLAQEIGSAVEEWSVIHPEKTIPTTEKFVSYPAYLEILDPIKDFTPLETHNKNPEGMMVKVLKDDFSAFAGFTVCAYVETGLTKEDKKESLKTLHAFNSVTGEVVVNDLGACS